ncbi:MAG: hypothetical protein ABWY01_05245 [Pseudoxanthomonas sp.]
MPILPIIAALILVGVPSLLALMGIFRARTEPRAPAIAWDWRLAILSALLYTVAFNLVFFVQELFLVLPKAFTPGLQPTLFHNNHLWQGEHPLASLFQGTGALATLLLGLLCLLLLQRDVRRSFAMRLFLLWLAYCGVFMALPQVVVGALSSGSDVGMAMEYLQLGATARNIAALLALASIPLLAREFARRLLGLAEVPARLAGAAARSRFVFQVATLPGLLATVLILPYRVPRELLEVVFLPLVVFIAGMPWIQAGAWRLREVVATPRSTVYTLAYPLAAALVLLLAFQWLLRPGIAFF